MRLGIVCGEVVLSLADRRLAGTRFRVVEVVTGERLSGGASGCTTLIVADHLSPDEGQMVAFVEGREAVNPYWPGEAPVDAYCSLIVDGVDYRPGSRSDDAGGNAG